MTIEANRKKRQREKAAKKLPEVVKMHRPFCHWCRRPVIIRRFIQEDLIFRETADYVYWRQDGREHMRLKATVDHVNPISEGGSNDLDNLVPSCGACNRARTGSDPIKFARRLERIWAELSKNVRMSGSLIHN